MMVSRPGRSEEVDVDPAAWEAAYRLHCVHLTRLATVLVGPDAAHDLVADTVLGCVSSTAWWEVDNPGGYLTRALVNAANARRRRDASRSDRERRVAAWRTPQRSVDDVGVGELAALRSLSPTQGAIVFLLYWEDLTIHDAARRLAISEGTVRKQLDRAKRRLRKVMTDDD